MQALRVSECLRMAERLSFSDTARLDVELILSHLLKKNRTFFFTWPEHLLTPEQTLAFNNAMARRENGEPVAHIIGEREFWSLPLKVNASTLIPRPDTEVLVETVLRLFPEETPRRCLDLGTGTGAIALAIASEKPHWLIHAVDFSQDAVMLACENRDSLGLSHVSISQSDWFSAVEKKFYDVIVSNPPYIDPSDHHLSEGDVRFEPLSALIAGENGMADLTQIITQAREFLALDGWLLLEHGYDQGEAVRRVFAQTGYVAIETVQDYGGNDRVSLAQWSPRSEFTKV